MHAPQSCVRFVAVVFALTLPIAHAQQDEHNDSLPEPVAVDSDGTDPADESESDDELDALLDTDLDSLRRTSVAPALDVEVTTVSRQKSTVGRSPAAVYVISEEMIRRSTARTIPELLRMVPGLHVAHIDGSKWSISSRGGASRFSDKLLVQIDGRTVYTPLFAGVYWDVQDLVLDDIKRIEVIRGPGATVWGANAVNGVINVITKSAAETRGVYVNAGGGSTQQAFTAARVGGRTDAGVDWRVSGKWYDRDSFVDPTNRLEDESQQGRLSFRTDWKNTAQDHLTVQGDWYQGKNGFGVDPPFFGLSLSQERMSGANVLSRWTRTISQTSDMQLQLYYDYTDRLAEGLDQKIETFDVDFQHRFSCDRHQLVWGLSYRGVWDRLKNDFAIPLISFVPEQRAFTRVAAFVQDEMTLVDETLFLTLGTKLSYNTFTDVEVQPSFRMLYLPSETSALWTAVSRAVRTPHRASEDILLLGPPLPSPPFPPNTLSQVRGNRSMKAEELIAYELGFRSQVTDRLAWDAAMFYNVYEDLLSTRTIVPGAGFPFTTFFNGTNADTFGLELSLTSEVTDRWKLRGWYTFLKVEADTAPISTSNPETLEGSTPMHQVFLASSWDLGKRSELDLYTRYVDGLPAQGVPHYIETDIRFSIRPRKGLALTVVGQNLLDTSHPEFGSNRFTGEIPTEAPRGVYGMVTFRY